MRQPAKARNHPAITMQKPAGAERSKKPCISHRMEQQAPPSNLQSFDGYLKALGKKKTTGYRWRKAGLIETVNIYGRIYVTAEAIASFEKRAIRGDFAKGKKI
jgi:hypothetical protein